MGKIVIFNLFALSLLIAGILLLDPTRHSLLLERSKSMTIQARNLAKIISLEIDKEQNQNEDNSQKRLLGTLENSLF